jgi:hypothetical protein
MAGTIVEACGDLRFTLMELVLTNCFATTFTKSESVLHTSAQL